MEQIQLTATLPNIAPGNLAEFKESSPHSASEITKGEGTTLQYDWFFSDDETKCVVRETYTNSDAVLSHMANVGRSCSGSSPSSGAVWKSRPLETSSLSY